MRKLTLISALAVTFFSSCEKELPEPYEPGYSGCIEPVPCVKEHTSNLHGEWILIETINPYWISLAVEEELPFYLGTEIVNFNLSDGIYTSSYNGVTNEPMKFSIEERMSYVTKQNEDFLVYNWETPEYTWPIVLDSTFTIDSTLTTDSTGFVPEVVTCFEFLVLQTYFEIKCGLLYIHDNEPGGLTKVYERLEYGICGTH